MRTLVIVSHPDILESSSQQYLLNSIPDGADVTIHHLEGRYPNGIIDVDYEQALLKQHDRILFQFPFYWYSSPALLKAWQDDVLTDGFAYGKRGKALIGKEFGLILLIGVGEHEYQAGGKECYSINELTKPYQAMAHKTGMTYLKPFTIFQFAYMTEEKRMDMLVKYQQMLTREKDDRLRARENWFITQLKNRNKTLLDESDDKILNYAIELLEENRITIDELKIVLDQMQ